MKILALDTGLATGVALFDTSTLGLRTATWSYDEALKYLESWMSYSHVTVHERFTITARTLKLSRQYEALYLIGAIQFVAARHGIPVVPQLPGDALSFTTNDDLKLLGWYTPGPDHANAACKHLRKYLADHERAVFKKLTQPGTMLT